MFDVCKPSGPDIALFLLNYGKVRHHFGLIGANLEINDAHGLQSQPHGSWLCI